MTSKADLSTNKPTITQLQQVASGELITAEVENANNLLNLNAIILAYNWIVDNGADLTLANVYSLAQIFTLGLKTNLIEPLTADANIIINNGTGGVYKNSVTANNKILTQAEVAALITSGSDVVDKDYGDITVTTTVDPGDTWTIDNNAVTEAKLASNAVTAVKIADNAVTEAKIIDDAVTTDKILDSNVTTAKIADNAVTEAKIIDDAVTTDKILDSNVTTAKIADSSVTVAKISATGTAGSTTFLRGDGVWSPIATKLVSPADQTGIGHAADTIITNCTFTPAANTTYRITASIPWLNSLPTANGARFGLTTSGTLNQTFFNGIIQSTTSGNTIATYPLAGTPFYYTFLDSDTDGNFARLEVFFRTGASPSGTLSLIARAETSSGTVTVRAGAFMEVEVLVS